MNQSEKGKYSKKIFYTLFGLKKFSSKTFYSISASKKLTDLFSWEKVDFVRMGRNKRITYKVQTGSIKDKLIIEEYENRNKKFGKYIKGWFYLSKADYFVFVFDETKEMVFLANTLEMHNEYQFQAAKNKKMYNNKMVVKYGTRKAQGSFKIVDIDDLKQFIHIYKY